MAIDWNKPVQTRDGHKARVLATDLQSRPYPVVVAVTSNCEEIVKTYTKEGRWLDEESPDGFDLINVPEKHVGYVKVTKPGPEAEWRPWGSIWGDRDACQRSVLDKDNTMVARIEWEG